VFEILLKSDEPQQAKTIIESVKKRLQLSDYESGSYAAAPETMRFDKILRFATIGPVKAGWMLKNSGLWSITEDGKKAYERFTDPEEFTRQARIRYYAWKKTRVPVVGEEAKELEIAPDQLDVEDAAEKAWEQIDYYLSEMPPSKFEELVAALLRAMGYHIAWKAEGGKDGGLDVLAYSDPLGAAGPRIKVQVKRTAAKVAVDGLRSFLALLGPNDTGVYVSLGGFTSDASSESRSQDSRRVILVDGRELVRLWTEYNARVAESDRALLPLRPIWFLETDE
jgi:restriction system protein